MLISVGLLALVFAGWSVYRIWDARLGPFSTGTPHKAFLGTTFGMSPQEVRRSFAIHGAQLLSYEDYRKTESSPSIDTFGVIPLFSDDRRADTAFYMSSIEMFDSKVEAEFSFRQGRLGSVGVHIDPIAKTKAESVVTAVESKLRGAYQFLHREESREVPGAYTLNFKSPSANASLWVNLTEPERPIIILTVAVPTTRTDRKREIQNRENAAF